MFDNKIAKDHIVLTITNPCVVGEELDEGGFVALVVLNSGAKSGRSKLIISRKHSARANGSDMPRLDSRCMTVVGRYDTRPVTAERNVR